MEFAASSKDGRPVQSTKPPLHIRRGSASASSTAQLVALLKPCPLMFGIDEESLEEFADLCTLLTFDRNDQIFVEGESSRGLWVLIDGRLRLYHSDVDGRQVVIGFPAPHSTLDLAAALDGRAHTMCAVALQRSRLVFFPQQALVQLAHDFPTTVRNAIRQLCRDLRQRDISHAVLSLRGARGRISCTLLQLARQYGVRHSGRVKIDYPLTRQDLADRSGVTLETAIRVLSDLRRRGMIATESRVIEILDEDALEASSECDTCEMDCSVFAKPTVADVQPLGRAEARPTRSPAVSVG